GWPRGGLAARGCRVRRAPWPAWPPGRAPARPSRRCGPRRSRPRRSAAKSAAAYTISTIPGCGVLLGLVTVAHSPVRLRAPVDDELCHLAQQLRPLLEAGKATCRAIGNRLGAAARFIDAEHGDEGRLAGRLILADRFAGDGCAALDIEQIVRN